jgi:hypothetical protein
LTSLTLDGAHPCSSEADAVSVTLTDASAAEFLGFLTAVGGVQIRSERDLSSVKVSAQVSSVPWDCLLGDMARQLGLTVRTAPEGIVLADPGKPEGGT